VSARGEAQVVELPASRQAHARRVAEARATIPDFELTFTLEAGSGAPSLARVIHAAAHALREQPRANSSYRDGRLEVYPRVNVGFAVFGAETAVQPTVVDADTKSVEEIETEVRALRARAEDGSITAPELAGATFSVTALDVPGLARLAAVLQPPHAAALASTGSTLTLSCDARALLPPEAAALLSAIRAGLE